MKTSVLTARDDAGSVRQTGDRSRVLVILENNPFPHDTRVRHEVNSLAEAGYEVTVIAPAVRTQALREELPIAHVYRYRRPAAATRAAGYVIEYTWAMLAILALSIRVALTRGFDIIHVTNPPDMIVPLVAIYKFFGKKIIFDHHDLSPELYCARFGRSANGFIHRVLLWLERSSCRLADHVIATNESYKRTQKERCGLDESRITVVRNGPQAETFKPCDPDDYLAAVGRHIICYAGVTNGPDGADLLLHSAAYLVNELGRKDVLFVVIGNGDAMPQLRQLVVDLALEPYIWMTGWVSDRARLLRYLSAADICVAPEPANPYNDSSTMVKIVEYMAMAKPIVAFDLPEHRFSAGDAALYVAGDGPEHFARAIDELLRDRARRSAMGMIGRLRVESRLSWEHSAVHLVDAYERVRARKKNAEVRLRLFNRSPKYLTARLRRLLGRYSLRPQKAMNRVHACVASLATRKCRPTFAVPGRVVASRPEFFQSLQDRGVELAIHGFDHVDFRTLSDREADEQLLRATNAFRKAHVSVSGIRCPYLSGTPQLISRLATDPFLYSSNQSISWNGHGQGNDSEPTLSALSELYTPDDARFTVALPHKLGNVLELPISLPDDLQLFDGRGLRGKALAREWMQVIDKIYDRGELCVLMFHPELFYELGDAFAKVLEELNALDPPVWIAQLREVAKWWQERERVSVQCRRHGEQITLKFDISDRATILVRDRSTHTSPRQLVTGYRAAQCREITLRTRQLPFIGCRVGVPQSVITFLKNDGFVVVTGDEADNCVVVVDPIAASRLSARELLEWVDSQNGTLIRIWRWPNGARSAFCMTGDLDALSLKDYAARLFT